VFFGVRRIPNMHDPNPQPNQDIGDQTPMAAPPEHFGTHHRGAEAIRQHEKLHQSTRELLRIDVIGVPTKGGNTPAGVR
jgi:hypothetical protein